MTDHSVARALVVDNATGIPLASLPCGTWCWGKIRRTERTGASRQRTDPWHWEMSSFGLQESLCSCRLNWLIVPVTKPKPGWAAHSEVEFCRRSPVAPLVAVLPIGNPAIIGCAACQRRGDSRIAPTRWRRTSTQCCQMHISIRPWFIKGRSKTSRQFALAITRQAPRALPGAPFSLWQSAPPRGAWVAS